MKPEDLDDHAPIEPGGQMLARVRARSRSFRKRRNTQRIASVTTALLVLALSGAVAWARVDTANRGRVRPGPVATTTTDTTDTTDTTQSTTPAPAPTTTFTPTTETTTTATPVTEPTTTTTMPLGPPVTLSQIAILGRWRPVTIAGYSGSLGDLPAASAPRMSFNAHGGWNAWDGCNTTSGGSYRLDGIELRFEGSPVTDQIGCAPGSHPDFGLVYAAALIELRDDQLTFLTADGVTIARFVRSGVVARIELPATTMTAGSQMFGVIVVNNYTGEDIHTTGCGGIFAAEIGNDQIPPETVWPACLMDITIPAGETTYPVTIRASYSLCTNGDEVSRYPRCSPPGHMPPLPPGDYQVTLAQQTIATPPPPIDVKVVP